MPPSFSGATRRPICTRAGSSTLSQDLDEAFAAQEPIVDFPAGGELGTTPSKEELLVTEKLAVARAANELHEKLKLGRRSAASRCPAWI